MDTLFFSHQPAWEPRTADHMSSVAFSVAEAALKSGPSSPSFGQSMSALMDTMPCDAPVATFPRLRHRSSFAGRPLWDVVEHAKERREKNTRSVSSSFDFEVTTPRSNEASPVEPAFLRMRELQHALPRLSAREFATDAEHRAATIAHSRTQSEAYHHPSDVLRSQAGHRPLARLPSLAQIQAKMTTRGGRTSPSGGARRPNGRSDSLDSNDSEGPQTPTDEWTSFDFHVSRIPATPDTPSKESSRLAPFLRERTNGRLARPKSMPPLFNYDVCPPSPESPPRRVRPAPLRTQRQNSLPGTPQSVRRLAATRSWTVGGDVTTVVTPSKSSPSYPTSPTESEHSVVSSTFSLPIITCTPAGEEDSDEESEGDVIVFAGDLEENDDTEELEELEEERREREFLGREMLFRLSRRNS